MPNLIDWTAVPVLGASVPVDELVEGLGSESAKGAVMLISAVAGHIDGGNGIWSAHALDKLGQRIHQLPVPIDLDLPWPGSVQQALVVAPPQLLFVDIVLLIGAAI